MKKVLVLVIIFSNYLPVQAKRFHHVLEAFRSQSNKSILQPWRHLLNIYALSRHQKTIYLSLSNITSLHFMKENIPKISLFNIFHRPQFKEQLHPHLSFKNKYQKKLSLAYQYLEREFHWNDRFLENKIDRMTELTKMPLHTDPGDIIEKVYKACTDKSIQDIAPDLIEAQQYIALDACMNHSINFNPNFIHERYRVIHEIDLVLIDRSKKRLEENAEDIAFILDQFDYDQKFL